MSHLLQNNGVTKDSLQNNCMRYSIDHHKLWQYLYITQKNNLETIACPAFMTALQKINLPIDYIPQIEEVSRNLFEYSGWRIKEVDGLIENECFFDMLKHKTFPSTTYIRNNDEIELSKSPDIFHELFGHCPLLTSDDYSVLMQKFGDVALQLDKVGKKFIQRLFWFTLEVGLIRTNQGVKIYGGSLLSSSLESFRSIYSTSPIRKTYNVVNIFRTPYRADLAQQIYYIIEDVDAIFNFLCDISYVKKCIEQACTLGEFAPLFPIDNQYDIYTSYNIC